jgi:anti-anti-sigma regulatory factor
MMLRITVDRNVDSIAVRLEGKLVGAWVQEFRAVWSNVQSNGSRVVISLTGVSSIDVLGRCLLAEVYGAGGRLTGSGLLAKSLIEDVTGIPS